MLIRTMEECLRRFSMGEEDSLATTTTEDQT